MDRKIGLYTDNIGILTFHCADNYGAMLQAYGLKEYLHGQNVRAEIVCYEPPFMTGRHWWIPYIPTGGLLGTLNHGWSGWKRNIRLGRTFFERRANMKRFRKKFLTGRKYKKLFFCSQLKNLPYQHYIIGSDQIWNPDITLGLRKAYFGAFENDNRRNVIAYAASLGGTELKAEYDVKFAELLKSVDHISVRESETIPYIKQFHRKDIMMVPDPVFLLKKEDWQKIEKLPGQEKYILVYMTEKNNNMVDYVKRMAEEEGLLILKLAGGMNFTAKNVFMDCVAGPSEFLGYVDKAEYVVTNSFHGVAFSIIFHKKFLVFKHSSVGARIDNVLRIYGLRNRMYKKSEDLQKDFYIDWNIVDKCIEENVKVAEHYLMTYLNE